MIKEIKRRMTDSRKPHFDRGGSVCKDLKNWLMANGINIDYCSGETSVDTECGWAPQQGSFSFPKTSRGGIRGPGCPLLVISGNDHITAAVYQPTTQMDQERVSSPLEQ